MCFRNSLTRQRVCRVSPMMLRLLSACLLLFLSKHAAASEHTPAPATTATDTTAAVNQSENLLCESTPRWCPAFFDDESRAQKTIQCCHNGNRGSAGLTFHAQRTKDRKGCQCACVPVIICSAGKIPILHHFQKDKALFAYIKCEPCPDGSFEPKSRKSYEYRDPVCPERHQTCRAENGRAMVRKGNSTHDTMCRCLWEQGFVPLPNNSVCSNSVTGFNSNDECNCKELSCPPNMRRNNEYKCVPIPPATEEPVKSTANYEDGDKGTPDVATPKQGTSKEQETEPEEDRRTGWWWLYPVFIFLAILIAGIFTAFKFHP